MGFKSGSYATIWGVDNKGKYSVVELSTSKKNKDTNQYETDFSSKFVRFIGTANTVAQGLGRGDKIKLGDVEVTNSYNKETKTSFTNFLVFSCEESSGGNKQSNTSTSKGMMNIPDGVDDELPFN